MRLLPSSASIGARRIFATRALRAVADGLVAASLSKYLTSRGFSEARIGALITLTLLGSAVIVVAVARWSDRAGAGQVLRWSAAAMVFTGAVFASVPWFAVLAAAAAVGPLNPSAGDVSAFMPSEQSLLPGLVADEQRTALFARYGLVGYAGGAAGSALAGLPLVLGRAAGWGVTRSLSMVFWFYACIGVVCVVLYTPLARAAGSDRAPRGRLGPSRRKIQRLTLLFCVDSAGGGLVVTSLIAIWLDRRHGFSLAQVGGALSAMQLLSAASSLTAPALARRIGLVRTMVVTHIPSNVLLILVAFAPNGPTAVALLLARSLLSQMDVPARQSYVMSIVQPSERAAAAAYTNVPRSLAAATTPALAGWMLGRWTFGWPLVIGGLLKAGYDLALLHQFGRTDTTGRSAR